MTTSRIFGLALLLIASACTSAMAADDAAALVAEFRGDAPSQTRNAADLQAAFAKAIDSLLPAMGGDDLTARTDAWMTMDRITHRASRVGADADRAALCKAILTKLAPPTSQMARVWLIRQLQSAGGAESVDALVGLLSDKDAEVAETARRALQKNSSEKAGAALRAALDTASTPAARVAFVNAVGNRKDAVAIGSIAKLAADKDLAVALAAVRALGNIGTPEAAKAVAPAQASADAHIKAVADNAFLLCADNLVAAGKKDDAVVMYQAMYVPAEPVMTRIAALKGLAVAKGEKAIGDLCAAMTDKDPLIAAAAIQFTADVSCPDAAKAFAGMIAKVTPPCQKALICSLGLRGDVTAKPAILEATKSGDESVRGYAIAAVGLLGDASDIAALAKFAAAGTGSDAPAARAALARLRGADIDAALANQIVSGDAKVRVELIKAIAARRATVALPAVIAACRDVDETVRVEALNALGSLADEKCMSTLIALLGGATTDAQVSATEGAMAAVLSRVDKKEACSNLLVDAMASAKVPAQCALLRLMGKTGGAKALAAVRAGRKDSKPEVQEASIRALADWPDVVVSGDLLLIAKDSAVKKNLQVVALRGYIRLAATPGLKVEDRLAMYKEAMALGRTDEKKTILSGLGEIGQVASLELIAPCLDEKGLGEESSAAAVSVAKQLNDKAAALIKTTMEKVLKVSKNKKTTDEAQRQLDRANKALAKGKK